MDLIFFDPVIFTEISKEIKEICGLLTETVRPYHFLSDKPVWLDAQEVCIMLNISKRSLQNYKDKRVLGCTRLNRRNYFKFQEVQALLHRNKITSKTNSDGTN